MSECRHVQDTLTRAAQPGDLYIKTCLWILIPSHYLFPANHQRYSFYFAFNAIGSFLGPILYLWLSRYVSRKSIIVSGFTVMIAGGVLICLFGGMGPLFFTLALFPATLMGCCVRPPGTFLMLEQQKEDAGSASALISCFGLLFGSAGMIMVSLEGSNLVLSLGGVYVAVGLACLTGWLLIDRLNLAKEVPDIAGTLQ